MIWFEENRLGQNALECMRNGIYSAMYTAYDTEKDFMPQFLTNSDKILKITAILETEFDNIMKKSQKG